MPFKEINVKKEIDKKIKTDAEFDMLWNEKQQQSESQTDTKNSIPTKSKENI